jgi:hypothetical protein
MINMTNHTRALTDFEIARLESVIANEARCNANGMYFCGYDIEQEGRFIMGAGQYWQNYASGNVEPGPALKQ